MNQQQALSSPCVADGAKERAHRQTASVQHQPAGAASPTGLCHKEGVFSKKENITKTRGQGAISTLKQSREPAGTVLALPAL